MSGTKDFDRLLLPRWLNSSSAILSMGGSIGATLPKRGADQFRYLSLERDWQRAGGLYNAIDFISAASIYGDWSNPLAIQAAKFVLNESSSGAIQKDIAQSFLRGDCVVVPDVSLDEEENVYRAIGKLRKYLSDNSMDPLAWLDLSYYYALSFQTESSLRSMQVAAELAKKSAFVVKSAARAFLHFGDRSKSLEVLRRSFEETGDLSIAVSEVAIAQQSGSLSKYEDRIFKAFRASPNRLRKSSVWSEIGATVATKESLSGSHKKAKKSAVSVVDSISNENVLAQLEWLASRENFRIGNKPVFYGDFEADAISAYNEGRLDIAARHCVDWARFQPFSSAPGMHGSYVASVALADFELAEKLSSYAYRFSSDEFLSINNYAFSLAANDKSIKALEILSELNIDDLETKDFFTFAATSGFILFKLGEIESARASYGKALEGFKKSKFKKSYAIAAHFWMMVDEKARSESLMDEVKRIAKDENIIELKYYYNNSGGGLG